MISKISYTRRHVFFNEYSYPLQAKLVDLSILFSSNTQLIQPNTDLIFVSIHHFLPQQTSPFVYVLYIPFLPPNNHLLSPSIPTISFIVHLPYQNIGIPTLSSSLIPLASSIPLPLPSNTHPMHKRDNDGIHKPNLILLIMAFTTKVILLEPSCYKEVRGIPEWKAPMRVEYEDLLRNHSWKLVLLPPRKKKDYLYMGL